MTIDLDVESGPVPARLSRRRQRALVAAVVVAVAGAALAAVNLDPPPRQPRPSLQLDGSLGWVEKLVDAPPRGGLAADEAFVTEMTGGVTQIVRSEGFHHPDLIAANGVRNPLQEVRLIYADDVGDARIVLLALRIPFPAVESTGRDPFRNHPGRTKVVWVTAPRGASASTLTTAFASTPLPGLHSGSVIANPLLIAVVGDDALTDDVLSGTCADDAECTMIALVPPECTFATASDDPTDFQPEPTGSYLVRTPQTYRPEYWRITCDGVIREERPVPPLWQPSSLSPDDVSTAIAELAGLSTLQIRQVSFIMDHLRLEPTTGPIRTVWVSETDVDYTDGGFAPSNATPIQVMVAVAPSLGSTWLACYSLYQQRSGESAIAATVNYRLDTDPTAPAGMLAILQPFLPDGWQQILAIAPPPATTVRLVDPDTRAVSESALIDGSAILTPDLRIPDRRLPGAQVVALDATGTVVATTQVATPGTGNHTANWD